MRAFEGGDFGVQSSNCGVQSWNGQTHKVSAAQPFVRDSSWFFSQTPKTNPDPWKFLKYTNACCSPLFDWAYMPELQKKYRRNSMRNSTDHGRWVTECGWISPHGRWQVVSCAESLRPGRIFSSSRRIPQELPDLLMFECVPKSLKICWNGVPYDSPSFSRGNLIVYLGGNEAMHKHPWTIVGG